MDYGGQIGPLLPIQILPLEKKRDEIGIWILFEFFEKKLYLEKISVKCKKNKPRVCRRTCQK